MPSARALAALCRATGVTRVARVTGLDRAGVEVACAVRPLGHVLQVSNGKGARWADARAGAALEAAELWASERVDPLELRTGSQQDLEEAGLEAWPCAGRGWLAAPRLWGRRVRIAWRRAVDLGGGGEVWVPAAAVHCPPPGGVPLGPAAHRWTSNGMGAHPDRAAALLHALLEAAERDGLARALPAGWTPPALSTRLIDPASLPDAPRRLARALARRGLRAFFFDLRPGASGLPLCGALLADDAHAPVPLTAGYACALRREEALLSALREAAQSRLTDVHGAREDVAPADHEGMAALAAACARARPRRLAQELPDLRVRSPAAGARAVLAALAAQGHPRAAAVRLDPPGFPAAVVKVIVPTCALSELL